jgi:Uma2 family endonuclease
MRAALQIPQGSPSGNFAGGRFLFQASNSCRLGWLIDPTEKSVLAYERDRLPELLTGAEKLPVLEGINLVLTIKQVFSCKIIGMC